MHAHKGSVFISVALSTNRMRDCATMPTPAFVVYYGASQWAVNF